MAIDFKSFKAFVENLFEDTRRLEDFKLALSIASEWFDNPWIIEHDIKTQPILAAKSDPQRFNKAIYAMSLVTNGWGHCKIPAVVYRTTLVKNPYAVGRVVLFKHPYRKYSSWSLQDPRDWADQLRIERFDDPATLGKWDTTLKANPKGFVIWTPESEDIARKLEKFLKELYKVTPQGTPEGRLKRTNLRILGSYFKMLGASLLRHEKEVILFHPKGIKAEVLARFQIEGD